MFAGAVSRAIDTKLLPIPQMHARFIRHIQFETCTVYQARDALLDLALAGGREVRWVEVDVS